MSRQTYDNLLNAKAGVRTFKRELDRKRREGAKWRAEKPDETWMVERWIHAVELDLEYAQQELARAELAHKGGRPLGEVHAVPRVMAEAEARAATQAESPSAGKPH
jgi:hypothetical protein